MRRILFIITLITSTSAAAFDNQRWLDCSNINNNDDRLACYDRVANSLKNKTTQRSADKKQAPQQQPAATTATTSNVAPKAVPPVVIAPSVNETKAAVSKDIEAGFGLEHKKTEAEQATDSVTLTISKAKQSVHGHWTLIFENGQKWQTLSNKRMKFKQGEQVVISRGIFNSFLIRAIDSNRSEKVKRIK